MGNFWNIRQISGLFSSELGGHRHELNGHGPSGKTCCGQHPFRIPHVVAPNRGCCDNGIGRPILFNSEINQCCDDGTVSGIGGCRLLFGV